MDKETGLYAEQTGEEDGSDVLTDLLFILVLGQMFVLSWFAHQELANRVSLPKGPLVDGFVQQVNLDEYIVLKLQNEEEVEWVESGNSEFISISDGYRPLLDRLASRQPESIVIQADGELRHKVVEKLQLRIRSGGIAVLKQHELEP